MSDLLPAHEWSPEACDRLLDDLLSWRTLVYLDTRVLYVCIEHRDLVAWRGVVTLFPDGRCWGFGWGDA